MQTLYRKQNSDYWENGIKEKRAEIRESIKNAINPPSVENMGVVIVNMTAEAIKTKLNELGIKTRLRNLKRLQELLEDMLKNSSQN